MFSNRICKPAPIRFGPHSLASYSLSILAALSILGAQVAHSQTAAAPNQTAAQAQPQPELKPQPEREVIFEGLASYGNYRIFATDDNSKIYTGGIEYDRHSWGYALGAQMDYVAEFLPFILFNEMADTDLYGNQLTYSPNRRLLYGIGFSPIGLRMIWRDKKAIKPYILVKGGMLVFDHKAISDHAAYENFTMQSGLGVQMKMTKRVDLRLGLWSDFHFSDGFVVPINPGSDMMNANWGVSYHLPDRADKPGRRWLPRF